MTQREENRKRAYDFIRRETEANIPGVSPNSSDTVLADKLGGTFGLKDDLISLKEGKSDPSPRLIKAFKELMGPLILETQIDNILVKPFSD